MEVGARLAALKEQDKRSVTMYGPDLLKTGGRIPGLMKTAKDDSRALT